MPGAISTRDAVEDDAEALLELMRELLIDGAGQVSEPDEAPTGVDEQRTWIRRFREAPHDLLRLACDGDAVVGILDFRAGNRKRLAHAGVMTIAVRPGWRGRGVGDMLMTELVTWAEQQPTIEKISLFVRADNDAALALYRKYGFVEQGRRPHHIKMPDGTYVDDVLMYRFV